MKFLHPYCRYNVFAKKTGAKYTCFALTKLFSREKLIAVCAAMDERGVWEDDFLYITPCQMAKNL